MSKERELLQSVMEESWDFLYAGTHTEIKELLAQPEQTEQEPVAWMYEWEEIGGKEWTSVKNGKYPPIVEEEYCMRNLRPLYTSLPKREPLSDAQIAELWGDKHSGKTHMVKNFARAIEKAHGITGGGE